VDYEQFPLIAINNSIHCFPIDINIDARMQTSGFTNAPVSQILVFWVVGASVLAAITDTKYFFHIAIDPHLLQWRQYWRLLTWQTCYANSTEVLFASMTFYNLRIIERLWGSRKFAVCRFSATRCAYHADSISVLYSHHASIYTSPTAVNSISAASRHLQSNPLYSCGSNTTPLCAPRPISRCDPILIYIPHWYLSHKFKRLIRYGNTQCLHQIHIQINKLLSSSTAGSESVPILYSTRCNRMDRWLCVAE